MAKNKLNQDSIEDLLNDPDSYITWRDTDDRDGDRERYYAIREHCDFFDEERYSE